MTKKLISELSLGRYIKHVNDAGNDIIKQYDKRIKLRTAGASKNDPDMKKASKRIARREKGIGMAANAFERFTKKNRLEEDGAPTVNAGGGNVAGIGVGPQGEPGVSTKAQRRQSKNKSTPTSVILGMLRRKAPNPLAEETFAGAVVFEVNSKLFHNLTLAKRKGKHWRTYLEEDDCYAEIREWARKNKGPIVVRNECTGEMRYVRYGR